MPLTRFAIAALLAWLLLAGQARALDPERRLSDYKHSHWTAMEGAPPILYALTQDKAGYLIIGSAAGLYRFDGLTFEHIPSPDPEIDNSRAIFMLNAPDGTIWIAYDTGLIATYRNSELRLDRTVPRLALEPSGILQTRDGTIWVSLLGTERTLLRRRNGRWQRVRADFDADDHSATVSLYASRDGSLWLQTYRALYVQREGQARFARVAAVSGRTVLNEDRRGVIWASDDRGTRPLLSSPDAAFPTPPFRRWTAVTRFDRHGNLWLANAQGLFRVRAPDPAALRLPALRRAAVEGLTSKDGLTADTTTPLFEDREGSIWVGTTRGLDQFRDVSIVNEPALTMTSGRSLGLLAASDGTVYAGTADSLYRIAPGGRPERLAASLLEPRLICEAAGGEIWAMGSNAFVRVRNGRAERLPVPAPFAKLGPYDLGGCATDARGVLFVSRYWVGNPDSGLFALESGRWRHIAVPSSDWAKALDRSGRGVIVWAASGAVGRLDAGGRIVDRIATVPVSKDHMIQVTPHGILLGGELGLTRIRHGVLRTLGPDRFPWLGDTTGLAETPQGETWLMSRAGIVGVETRDLDRAFDDPRATVKPIILDFQDGLPDVRILVGQHGAVRGGDGRIWAATVGGIVWVDPARLVRNPLPPLVHIRGLTAGTASYRDPPATMDLAKGTTNVAIRYAGLSLTVPQRVRFRYQLEGVDAGWIDPGARREAFYTNLGAGTYRFRVLAANDDGVWNRQGATLQFTIPPTFLQSVWFKLLCFLLLGLLVAAIVGMRTRAVRAGLQARFDVRMAERERIARELHDTLLQSVQGLILMVQSSVDDLPDGDPRRASVERALDQADRVLGEGRDQVQGLRSDRAPPDLAEALGKAADAIRPAAPLAFHVHVDGTPRALRPAVVREIVRIAEEALRNAARHAAASAVAIRLTYRPHAFDLTIADDGIGIAAEIVGAGRRDGHYGLVGMRERAEEIAGRLEIGPGKAGGTEVRLSVPGGVAYQEYHARLGNRLRALGQALRRLLPGFAR